MTADYLALPRRTRELFDTYASLAEGAIPGTSHGSACTGASDASASCICLRVVMVQCYRMCLKMSSKEQKSLVGRKEQHMLDSHFEYGYLRDNGDPTLAHKHEKSCSIHSFQFSFIHHNRNLA